MFFHYFAAVISIYPIPLPPLSSSSAKIFYIFSLYTHNIPAFTADFYFRLEIPLFSQLFMIDLYGITIELALAA